MTCRVRMNSVSRLNNRGGVNGFTLLEIVFVLGLLMVMIAWVVISVTTVETEQRLREASGGIESLAKRARNAAVTQQRDYQLTISEESISIAPRFPMNADEDDSLSSEESSDENSSLPFRDVFDSEDTDPKVTYEIRRWGSDDWVLIKDDERVVINIDPAGLVEPISIRCTVGESWLIQELHPLTAGVRDEQLSVIKE